jgi:hypothetical protein
MPRSILFSSKMWNVEVQDNLGNSLVTFTNVPGNTKDEATLLIRGKLILIATQVAANRGELGLPLSLR